MKKIFFPPPIDDSIKLGIRTCGHQVKRTAIMTPQGRTLNRYAFIYIVSGTGYYRDNSTKNYSLSEGTLIIHYPNMWHCYDPLPGKVLEEYWVTFLGELADNLFKILDRPTSAIFPVGDNPKLKQYFEDIIDLCKLSLKSSIYRATALLHSLTTDVLLMKRGISTEKVLNDIFGRFIVHAQSQVGQSRIDIEGFLKDEPMGIESFRKKFKSKTGLYPHSYWLRCKLNLSKSLLHLTEKTISEIAYEAGIEDMYYFSKLFKRKEGISPREFRKFSRQ